MDWDHSERGSSDRRDHSDRVGQLLGLFCVVLGCFWAVFGLPCFCAVFRLFWALSLKVLERLPKGFRGGFFDLPSAVHGL